MKKIYLIPGFANDCQIYQPLIKEIKKLNQNSLVNFDFEAIDLPSIQTNKKFQLDENLLINYLQLLAEKIKEKSIIIASSLGAMLIMKLIEEKINFKINSIITIGANLSFIQRENWKWAMNQKKFKQFKNLLFKDETKAIKRFHTLELMGGKLINKSKEILKSTKVSTSETLRAHLFFLENLDLTHFFKSNHIPIHFIFAKNDYLVPYQSAFIMKKMNSEISYQLIENSGHLPMLSQASLLAKKINPILKNCSF